VRHSSGDINGGGFDAEISWVPNEDSGAPFEFWVYASDIEFGDFRDYGTPGGTNIANSGLLADGETGYVLDEEGLFNPTWIRFSNESWKSVDRLFQGIGP